MATMDELQKEKSALAPFVAEIRATLDQNRLLDSLVERLAMQQLALTEMRREITTLRSALKVRDVLLPELRLKHPGAHSVKLDAAMPLRLEDGFYALEYDGRGQPFRWTGPSPAFRFDVYVDRTRPMKFKLHMSRWKLDVSERMRAYCDNIELPLMSEITSSWAEYTGYLLPRETMGVSRLIFIVGQMTDASQTNPDDERMLGVAFRNIEITTISDDEVTGYLAGDRTAEVGAAAAAMAEESLRSAAATAEEAKS